MMEWHLGFKIKLHKIKHTMLEIMNNECCLRNSTVTDSTSDLYQTFLDDIKKDNYSDVMRYLKKKTLQIYKNISFTSLPN